MFCCGGGGSGQHSDDEANKFKVMDAKWDIDRQAIGEGGFGTVHLCTSRVTGKQRACKAMRLMNPQDREDFKAEVLILKQISKHRNICHIVDSGDDARFGYLVMQSCTGGELFDRITQNSQHRVTEGDAALAAHDILSALNFLHKRKILHRDLKPENLLYKDKLPGAPLKLIDFGLATKLHGDQYETEICGTTSYMAPEVLGGCYKTECDLWSLGVITYFMLSGTLPFPGRSEEEKESNIMNGRFDQCQGRAWKNVTDEAKDFVRSLLIIKPRQRLSGRRAMHHPWIAKRTKHSETPLSQDVAASLKRYADAHRFEKAIRHQMATHLTTSELHRLRNVFEKLDAEGTGTIKIDDLKKALAEDSADSHTAEVIAGMDLSNFDLDGDGEVDWQEFVAGAMHDHEVYNEDNLSTVFAKLDMNNDGKLCQREISTMLGQDHEFSREILENVKNSRGSTGVDDLYLTYDEFKELMTKSSVNGAPVVPQKASGGVRGRRHHHAPVSQGQYCSEIKEYM